MRIPDGEFSIGDPRLTPTSRQTAEFIQEALRTHLSIDIGEVTDGRSRSPLPEEQYDLTLNGWLQDYPDPENWLISQFGQITRRIQNCSDPEIDDGAAQFNADTDERLSDYPRSMNSSSPESAASRRYGTKEGTG
jgi:ABC-type oligopeptide transport system substrate-binding subunit